jgi:hypothetical protein
MNRITRKAIVVLVAVIMASTAWMLGAQLGKIASRRTPSLPDLTLTSNGLDFGEVWEDTAFPWTLQVQNHSDKDISISGFSHSCSCARIEPETLHLPSGATRELRLTIDLSENVSGTGSGSRPFRLRLSPNIDRSQKRPVEWTITGKVKTPVRLGQGWIDYGWQAEYDQPRHLQPVEVETFVPLRGLDVSSTSPHFKAEARRRRAESRLFDLEVTRLKNLPPGPVNVAVVVVPELANGRRLPAKRLPLIGHILSDLQAAPPAIIFGARRVGETVEETISLQSLVGKGFKVIEARVVGDKSLSVQPHSSASFLGGMTYRIQGSIGNVGDGAAAVIFVADLGNGKVKEIKVPVYYRAVPAKES